MTTRESIVVAAALLLSGALPLTDTRADGAAPDEEIARVLALSDDIAYGEYLAGECAACHLGSAAAADAGGTAAVPRIHGVEATHLVRALLEYRSGVRSNTTMRSVAGALGDEEVAVLAHYLASLPPAKETAR